MLLKKPVARAESATIEWRGIAFRINVAPVIFEPKLPGDALKISFQRYRPIAARACATTLSAAGES
jgi:hypothetical protein